jgi:phosphohistidine phosphatase SixA
VNAIDRRSALIIAIGLTVGGRRSARADDEDALWSALASGQAVAIMRHALAPGTGDPAGFRLDDCSTQRNLSDAGRAQAKAIGDRLRRNGIDQAEVRSSQWCRCLDTAQHLGLGPVEPMPALNSFFGNRSRGPAQTRELREFLIDREADQPLILVTHQVNITALTGVFPTSGEIVVITSNDEAEVRVQGTVKTQPMP